MIQQGVTATVGLGVRVARAEQVGASHGANHERPTREQRQQPAVRVDQEVAQVLRGMARRMDRAEAQRTDRDLIAAIQLAVRASDSAVAWHHEFAASRRAQIGTAGEKVVVDVRVQACRKAPAMFSGGAEIAVHVAQWIDDHRLTAISVDDEVAAVAELGGDPLLDGCGPSVDNHCHR